MIRKIIFLLGLLFACALPATAQITTVTGTISDANGVPYKNGTISATLISPGGTITAHAAIQPQNNIGLSVSGAFSINLADNSTVTPAGTKWQFIVCAAAGNPCTVIAAITISGASQDISATINAAIATQSSGPGNQLPFPIAAAPSFSTLTTGTNTIAAMLVGTGASFGPTGTGSVTANKATPAGTPGNCMKWGAGGIFGDFGTPCNPAGTFSVTASGAKCDARRATSTATTANTLNTVNDTVNTPFLGTDVGKNISVYAQTNGGPVIPYTTVASFIDTGHITTVAPANITRTNDAVVIIGTDDTTAILAAETLAQTGSGGSPGSVTFPAGNCLVSDTFGADPSLTDVGYSGEGIGSTNIYFPVDFVNATHPVFGNGASHPHGFLRGMTFNGNNQRPIQNRAVVATPGTGWHMSQVEVTKFSNKLGLDSQACINSFVDITFWDHITVSCEFVISTTSLSNFISDSFLTSVGGDTQSNVINEGSGAEIHVSNTLVAGVPQADTWLITTAPGSPGIVTNTWTGGKLFNGGLGGNALNMTGTNVATVISGAQVIGTLKVAGTGNELLSVSASQLTLGGATNAVDCSTGTFPVCEVDPISNFITGPVLGPVLPQQMLTSQYTNSTTTFSNVTGGKSLAFNVQPNTPYKIVCTLYYQAAATGGLNIEWTGPAAPTAVSYSLADPVALGVTDNSVATAFGTSLGNVVTTAATNFLATVTLDLVNGANAGIVQLLAKSSAAVQLQIQTGSSCRVQ